MWGDNPATAAVLLICPLHPSCPSFISATGHVSVVISLFIGNESGPVEKGVCSQYLKPQASIIFSGKGVRWEGYPITP